SAARNFAGGPAKFNAQTRSRRWGSATITRRAGRILPPGGGAAGRPRPAFIPPPRPRRAPRAAPRGGATRAPEGATEERKLGRGLDEVAAARQVEPGRRALGARRRGRAEGEQRLVRLYAVRIKPQPRARGIVGGKRAGGDRHLVDICR